MAFKRPTVRSRSAPPFNLIIRSLSGLQPKKESGRIDRPTVGIDSETTRSYRTDSHRVRSRSAPPFFMLYFIYVLKSETTDSSYVGYTSNLEKRLVEHNNGKSLSTRRKRPWRLVYKEEYSTRSEAASRERYFKSIKGRLELRVKGIL